MYSFARRDSLDTTAVIETGYCLRRSSFLSFGDGDGAVFASFVCRGKIHEPRGIHACAVRLYTGIYRQTAMKERRRAGI